MLSEFDIIKKYFSFSALSPGELGVGDDAAVLAIPPHATGDLQSKNATVGVPAAKIVAACDTLVADVHFPAQAAGFDVASRALAVNLSDFAAMGAVPRWLLMSLTLPDCQDAWLSAFSSALQAGCQRHGLSLVGGDTTRGPLAITFTVLGTPARPAGHGDMTLRRAGAAPGDELWVSGTLGGAAAWLALQQKAVAGGRSRESLSFAAQAVGQLRDAFYRPEPRLELGQALLGIASAAIDISDGLLADARHVANASGVTLQINGPSLPFHPALAEFVDNDAARHWVLAGGDDYELLFSAPAAAHKDVLELAMQLSIPLTCIGSASALANGSAVADESAVAGKSAVASPSELVTLHGTGWHAPLQDGYRHF
ncbi:MAG: thiamine-phosphate kinase [Pseudomonadales bacterium]